MAPRLSRSWGGLCFVWHKAIVLAAISLDLFAVPFGGAAALLPIYIDTILHGGPAVLGWQRAAPAIGALAMSLWLERHLPRRRDHCLRQSACLASRRSSSAS